uniref:Glucose-methanol-choline oxidoreductase N-terminal domain-containing protein n=2 Tax=Bionectria ochroleuca TaxID=29856 RepID=A0A0B7KEW9_BIOOC
MYCHLAISSILLATLAGATATSNHSEYEYVVVGSGPGGGTVAANLARAGHSVFLIEAGGDHGDELLQRVPAFSGNAAETANQSWSFFVSHYQDDVQARRDDKFTYSFPNGSYYIGLDPPEGTTPLGIFYPRGNTVGGSSQVNAMSFALPPDSDWRYIAQLTGDDSWLPESMRQIYIDLERAHSVPAGTPGRGFDGYISSNLNNVSYVANTTGVAAVVGEGIRRLEGIEVEDQTHLSELLQREINDLDTPMYGNGSWFQMPVHVDSLRRRSGARNFVIDTIQPESEDGSQAYPLTLSTHSLATRILFMQDGGRPKAVGVEYLKGEGLYAADRRYDENAKGELRKVFASREVIVAGGSFNTPQILKLSGVGPSKELKELGIPVVKDLPAAGNYMQDNYEGGVRVRASADWDFPYDTRCYSGSDECLSEWLEHGQSLLGEAGAPLSFTYRSSVSENEDADLFFFGTPGVVFTGFFPGYSTSFAFDPPVFTWSIVKMQTGNTAGTVTLKSSNPRDVPVINFNYFQEMADRDLQAMAEGANYIMEVFQNLGSPYTPVEVIAPNPEDVNQALMDEAFSHHVTSTCRMGPKDHPEYCVDSKFRVNGVKGLRVVDASVFPRTPGGFPVAPTFMVGLKAARTILAELEVSESK